MPSSGTGSQLAFLLFQRMRKEPAKGKSAPSWVTAQTEGSWTIKISRNPYFSCSCHYWLALFPKEPCSHQLASWRTGGPSVAILQHWPQGSSRLGKPLLQPADTALPGGLLSPLTAVPLPLSFESLALLFFLHLKASVMLPRRFICAPRQDGLLFERREVYQP